MCLDLIMIAWKRIMMPLLYPWREKTISGKLLDFNSIRIPPPKNKNNEWLFQISSSFHNPFFVISLSSLRHIIIIFSSYHHHSFVISSSFLRHIIIFSSSYHHDHRPYYLIINNYGVSKTGYDWNLTETDKGEKTTIMKHLMHKCKVL